MDRPDLPQNIAEMSGDDLQAAFDALQPFAEHTMAADEPDVEFLETFADVVEALAAKAEASRRATAALDRTTAALESIAEPEVADEPEADAAGDAADAADETEGDEPEADGETEGDETEPETEDEPVAHSEDDGEDDADAGDAGTDPEEPEVDQPNADDLAGSTAADEVADDAGGVVTRVEVAPGVPGFDANASLATRLEVAKALGAKWNSVGDVTTGEQFPVVSIRAEYPDFADLSDGDFSPLYDDELVAACAPLQPYYGVGFYSSESRPVFNSMSKFNAPRGGVTIYPSPRFSDPDLLDGDGMGQWTVTDDNNPAATKADPYDFECEEPVPFRVYGVYRSMTIRNLDAITFPELVAAHQNQLGSRFARYAEQLALDAMIAQTDATIHASATYGAARTIYSRFNTLAARYRENERLEDTQILQTWLPRWVRDALREDIIRAANDSGLPEIVTDAIIKANFADVGIDVTFTYDNPLAGFGVGNLATQGAGALLGWPDQTWFIMSARGNLAMLDLGSIDIGVNPNGNFRDSALTKRNRFQMFMESYEGVVNRGAPVWNGVVEVLPNGAQPAGVTAISSNSAI